MLFVDLEQLKIHKAFKYSTIGISLPEEILDKQISEVRAAFVDAFNKELSILPSIELCVEVEIEGEGVATEEETNAFLSTAIIFASSFFQFITVPEGRKREHRLDVPEGLKCLKVSMSALKNIINHRTIISDFNLILKYKDLSYMLCDEKLIPEKGEFVHDENGDVINDA